MEQRVALGKRTPDARGLLGGARRRNLAWLGREEASKWEENVGDGAPFRRADRFHKGNAVGSGAVWMLWVSPAAKAQGNYEIQVYGSELVDPGKTMVELHSNFTFEGSKSTTDGTYPTNHQLHETIEITHGFSDWFETGFYIFTSSKSG